MELIFLFKADGLAKYIETTSDDIKDTSDIIRLHKMMCSIYHRTYAKSTLKLISPKGYEIKTSTEP